jgi:twinkle protein
VTIDRDAEDAVWSCLNCTWAGATKWDNRLPSRKLRALPLRPTDSIERPTVEVVRWFSNHGIHEKVIRRNKIGFARAHYVAVLGRQVPCIAFPYYRRGELVNVKYRSIAENASTLIKGAEPIFYGLDDIPAAGKVIIVEDEMNKLALEEAGYRNVIAVPNAAPRKLRDRADAGETRFAFLASCANELEAVTGGFILALNNDANGKVLEEELARRLGKERCWRVRWTDSHDVPCKDAAEILFTHGVDVLRQCVEAAVPYPITGLYTYDDYAEEFLTLYTEGRRRGASTGWPSLDELMTIAPGQVSVVTGIPNHGKSEFLDALLINLAQRMDWRFVLCSFENEPVEHMAKQIEKWVGAPFWDGPVRRMTPSELDAAFAWGRERFFFIRAEDEAPADIDWILERARDAVLRHGSDVLVIDPYNEIEHRRPPSMTEAEFISQLLGKAKRFAKNHAVHVFIVAHPVKLLREGTTLPVPTLYDISGSANWANKADIGFAVHRPDPSSDQVEIHVHKVRHKWIGKPGGVTLRYDKTTGRYFDQMQQSTGAA